MLKLSLGQPLSGQRIAKSLGEVVYTNTTIGHFSVTPESAELMGFKKGEDQYVAIIPALDDEGNAVTHGEQEVPVLILIPQAEDSNTVSKVAEGNDSVNPKFVFTSAAAWKMIGGSKTIQRFFDLKKEEVETEEGTIDVFVLRHSRDEEVKPRKRSVKTDESMDVDSEETTEL